MSSRDRMAFIKARVPLLELLSRSGVAARLSIQQATAAMEQLGREAAKTGRAMDNYRWWLMRVSHRALYPRSRRSRMLARMERPMRGRQWKDRHGIVVKIPPPEGGWPSIEDLTSATGYLGDLPGLERMGSIRIEGTFDGSGSESICPSREQPDGSGSEST